MQHNRNIIQTPKKKKITENIFCVSGWSPHKIFNLFNIIVSLNVMLLLYFNNSDS